MYRISIHNSKASDFCYTALGWQLIVVLFFIDTQARRKPSGKMRLYNFKRQRARDKKLIFPYRASPFGSVNLLQLSKKMAVKYWDGRMDKRKSGFRLKMEQQLMFYDSSASRSNDESSDFISAPLRTWNLNLASGPGALWLYIKCKLDDETEINYRR